MNSHVDEMRLFSQLIQEAVDGTTDLRKSMDRIQKLYAQEADRFDLPDDYVPQKVLSDLMQLTHEYMQSSKQLIKDPRALVLLRTITNQRLDAKSQQLDQFARLPNPEQKP